MNEHESATASFFGSQLKRHECRECEREPGVARLAQCAAEDLGETSLGGRLGTHHPKYSRTITTPAQAPGSQEVDFLSKNFADFLAIVSFTSVSRGSGLSQVGSIPRPQ